MLTTRKTCAGQALILSLCLTLLPACLTPALGATLDFSQALELMKKNNNVLNAARSEEEQAAYEKKATRALYLPKVSIRSVYTQMDDPLMFDLNSVREAIIGASNITATVVSGSPAMGNAAAAAVNSRLPSFEKQVMGETFWRSSIDATWPIFTGGKILAANRAADEKLKGTKERSRSTEASLITELARRYFGLRLAAEVQAARKSVRDSMEKHYDHAKKMEESGMIARVERLHAEVAMAEADRQYRKSVHDQEIAQTALAELLSSPDPVTPSSPLFMHFQIDPLPAFKEQARLRNPLLKELAAQKNMAHQGYKKEIGTYSPEIALFGTREIDRCNFDIPTPKWAVGVAMNFTLFDGMGRYNKLQAAKARERRVAQVAEDAHDKIDTLVELQYKEMLKARERYESLKAAADLSTELVRIRQRAFAEGMATSLEVVDAELNASKVKIEKLQSGFEYDVALAKLLEASGRSEFYDQYRKKGHVEVEH